MVELTEDQFTAAMHRGKTRLKGPRAIAACYDVSRKRVVITLTTGIELGLDPNTVEGLANASSVDLKNIEVDNSGFGIHFPNLDADLYIPALFEGILGSRRWMAARLGAAGGKSRSVVKTSAARENGRQGGRPRKSL